VKTLMLLRHAKSSWDDEALPDHDRPLSKRGKKAAPRMGILLAEEELVPDLIRSSTAVRARKTAEAVAKACGYRGDIEVSEGLYLATAGKILGEAQTATADSVGRLLLVGHNPGMEDLVSILVEGKEAFPTAALAIFEMQIDRWAELELGVKAKLAHLWRPKELS
jgi:phosphohistidine phosphatase